MRHKMNPDEKRKYMIGVKVDQKTKQQIEWIADREETQTSTYIYRLIEEHIKNYERISKLNIIEEINKEVE